MSKNLVLDVIKKDGNYTTVLPEAEFRGAAKISQAPFPDEEVEGEWARWGANDSLPTDIRRKIEKSPMAGQTINKLISMMYGNGLAYYRNSDLREGNLNPKRAYIPEVELWLKRNKIRTKWLIPQFADYRMTMNSFSEFILNKRCDFITGLYHKSGEFCRLGPMNDKTMHIDKLFYSPDFGQLQPPSNNRRAEIPLYRWYDEDEFLRKLKGYKFAYHSRYETPGALYYARPWWIGLFRDGGWIDSNIAVPEIVNAMMMNQVILKYQILIPETYFEIRHQDWNTYTDKDKNKIIDELIDDINDTLSGTKNAYKSITTVFKQDPQGNAIGQVEIKAIDDKMKKDNWVPSSEKSDAIIVQGLGLPTSQAGISNQGGLGGAGSGSDMREGFNSVISLNTIDQDIELEPLNFMAQFNARVRPNFDVTFFIDHTHHTTTNNSEDGMKPSETTINPE